MNKEAKLFCEMYDDGDSKLAVRFPYEEMSLGSYAVDEESDSSGRWYDYVTTILKMGDRYFAFDWNRGKTEMQDDDFDDAEYYEVVPKTKTITMTEYVPKE